MKRKMASGLILTLTLAGILTFALSSQRVHSQADWGWIYILPDGTAGGGPISTVDNVTYSLTDDAGRIDVWRNNVVIEGGGYTLDGSLFGVGILVKADNITVRNMEIKDAGIGIQFEDREGITGEEIRNAHISESIITDSKTGIRLPGTHNVTITQSTFANNADYGVYLDRATNTTVWGNNITNNTNGIYLRDAMNTTVWGNNITNNTYGISVNFLFSSGYLNNIFYHNNLINNTKHADAGGDTGEGGTWDNGYPSCGNYWDDYDGVDADGDGVGDTPYIMLSAGGRYENVDYYPLMNPWTSSWAPLEPPTPPPFWVQWWFFGIVAVGIVALAGAIYFLKKRKPLTTTPPAP